MKLILKILLVTSLTGIISIVLFITTPLGPQLVMYYLNYRLPGQLNAQKIEGSLLSGLTITQLDYTLEDQQWVVPLLHVDWQWHRTHSQPTIGVTLTSHGSQIRAAQLNVTIPVLHWQSELSWQTKQLHWFTHMQAPAISLHQDNYTATLTCTQLSSNGTILDYAIELTSQLAVPKSRLQINASGKTDSLTVHSITLHTLDGLITGHAQLDWHPTLAWQLQLTGTQLKPHSQWPEWSGNLQFEATAQGNLVDGQHYSNWHLRSTDSQLFGHAFHGSSQWVLLGNRLTQLDAHWKSGSSQIDIRGIRQPHLNLYWKIAIDELGHWLPQGSGYVFSEGNVTGTLAKPYITASLTGRNLAYTDKYRIQALQGDVQWSMDDDSTGSAHFTAHHLWLGSHSFQQGQFKLQGTPTEHHLTSEWQGELGQLSLQLVGNYQQDKQWQGTLQTLSLHSTELGNWSLSKPNQITLRERYWKIHPLCWKNGAQAFCATSQGTADDWHATLELKQLDTLPWSHLWLDPPWQIQGHVTLTSQWQYQANQLSLQANLRIPTLILPQQGITLNQLYGKVVTHGSLLQYQLSGQYNESPFNVTGTTQSTKPYATQLQLTGEQMLLVNNEHYRIEAIPHVTLQIQENRVKLTGQLHIPKAHIYQPQLNPSIVDLTGDAIIISASPSETTSQLALSTDIEVSLGPDVAIDVYGLTGQLQGQLRILSTPQQPTTAYGNLTIQNGLYQAYGQTLTIEQGQLLFVGDLIENPGLRLRAMHTLLNNPDNIQKVGIIATGRLQHPVLQLVAEPPTLNQTDTLAYLLLGRSSRELNQADASLLLQAAKALNLGSNEFQLLKQHLQNTFGLDTLEITQMSTSTVKSANLDDLLSNAVLLIGKQLSPKLYLSYSIGLAGSKDSTLKVNYQLGKHWQIQAETTSENSGVDIFYTLEK